MPVVENETEEDIEYRVTDDEPPFERFKDKKILKKTCVEFDQGPTQSHAIKLHNGLYVKILERQPRNCKVTLRQEGDNCVIEVVPGPESPPGRP